MRFTFHNPVKVYFGPGEFDRAGELAARLGSRALVVTGQGSADRHGYLTRLTERLEAAGVDRIHFPGIEPNPHLETCQSAAWAARRAGCDMVLGLGGGSVMDACKAIAAGVYHLEDLWDFHDHGQETVRRVDRALPIMVIPTLAATGSEMNGNAVITRWATREKCVLNSPLLVPDLALIDPGLTLTVPLDYALDGVYDMAIHVMESYFNGDPEALLQGRIIEGFLLTALAEGTRLYADPQDLAVRGNVQWASALALSGFFTAGRGGPYPVHKLEHPLSAHWDISHGRGLALLMPRWMWYVCPSAPALFAAFARRVMQVADSGDDLADARAGIRALVQWQASVDLHFTLADLGLEDEATLQRAAADCLRLYGRKGRIDGIRPLEQEDVLAIYRLCADRVLL